MGVLQKSAWPKALYASWFRPSYHALHALVEKKVRP